MLPGAHLDHVVPLFRFGGIEPSQARLEVPAVVAPAHSPDEHFIPGTIGKVDAIAVELPVDLTGNEQNAVGHSPVSPRLAEWQAREVESAPLLSIGARRFTMNGAVLAANVIRSHTGLRAD